MRMVVVQPPYPVLGTAASAANCLAGMRGQLEGLEPGTQDLVLLPEYANTPGIDDGRTMREFAVGPGTDFLRVVGAAATRLQCRIALAAPTPVGDCWFNRGMLFAPDGNVEFTADKVHLTAVETDELGLTPGAGLPVFDLAGLRIGFAICFDLYFPEHFEALAAQRADLVLCPSYQRGESAERIRLIAGARALDSGIYVIRGAYAMGQAETGGHSLVAAPDGTILADAGHEPGIIRAEIDPRRKFVKPASHGRPLVEHRTLLESYRRPAVSGAAMTTAARLAATPFPRLCAHRGLSLACPENTLPAFAAAMAAGAHEIEFDVQASRDGVPVICHDPTVDRTTDGTGAVADMSWDDICRLDAGSRLGREWAGVRVPRLEEVLALVGGRVVLNVHVKDEDGTMTRRVCELLRVSVPTGMAYLALGSAPALAAACEYAPDIPRACLMAQDDPARQLAAAAKYQCARVQFGRQVTRDDIRQAHAAGLIANLFWSDDPDDARRYVDAGIDVILTNCAHTMIAGGLPAFPS